MKKIKTFILILLALLSIGQLFAQHEIRGHVLDSKGRKPIAAATVTLHSAGSQDILSYTITDDKGGFVLKRKALPDSVDISVRAMTIETQTKQVKSSVDFVEFIVNEKVTELKEVIVKAPKIRQLGDTIHYDVASFLNETDRNIGDILKKLPGVQVLSSGQIMYQNKAISKFYVEGLDLLQGKYGIATQNIDAKNVASVQVLENHQPIKALKDMEIPEAAAINLKLKQSALGAFFATAQVGMGLPKWLLSNELVAMRFSRSQQNMMVYKGDNTGRDIAQELVSHYDDLSNKVTDFLQVIAPSPPAIDRQHFLFNDAHLGSLNDLRSINKNLTLTTNLNYLFDKQKSNSYSRRDIFVENAEQIVIEEDMSARLLKRQLEGSLMLESNTENYYLSNRLNVSSKWNSESGDIMMIQPISQHLHLPSLHMANNFEYIKRKDKKRLRIKSSVAYTRQQNNLHVTPAQFTRLLITNIEGDSSLMQNVSYHKFATNTSIHRSIESSASAWYTASVFTNHYAFSSSLSEGLSGLQLQTDSLLNNITRGEIGFRLSPGMRIPITKKISPSINLPITWMILNKNDQIRKNEKQRGYWFFAPSLYLDFAVTTRIAFFANAGFNNNIGELNEDLAGYMMTSYRNLNRNNLTQSRNSTTYANASFSYRNPFTTLFASLRINWSQMWRNTLYDTHYNGILSNVTSILYPNSAQNYGAGISFGKSIDKINSETKCSLSYRNNSSLVLHQGIVSHYKNDNFDVSGSITSEIGKFMIVRYEGLYSVNHLKISNNKLNPMQNFRQTLHTSFIPKKGLIFNLAFNHYHNNAIQSSARSSWFGNVGIKYKLKKMDLMLDWTNIFNTRQFVTYSYSDVSSYYSEYMLRPSEVLLRVRFKIL